ncbi:MAG: hypothetical protein EAZ92_13455 [Candidatus Kapaibacterium sp.]|nr:MAG: hypothetical protein EAZ92_13455 [Candidatus Kapabacteria bacterium]
MLSFPTVMLFIRSNFDQTCTDICRVFFCILLFSMMLQSCSKQKPLENYNFYGGTARASNYELSGSFSAMIMTDVPKEAAKKNTTEPLPNGAVVPPIAVTFNHNYLASSDGYALRYANNKLEWKSPLDTLPSGKRAVAASFPAADVNDNYYLLANDGAAYSFDKTGKRRFKQALFAPSMQSLFSDLLLLKSSIITAFSANGTNGTLVKSDVEGKVEWRKEYTLAPTRTIAADEQENIFVALSNNESGKSDSVLSLAPNGSVRWVVQLAETRITKSPALSVEASGAGMVLLAGIRERKGERTDILLALDAQTGKMLWEKTLTFAPQGMSIGSQASGNQPLIVVAGYRVGVGEPLTLVYGFDQSGKELWRLSYDLAVIGAPMIGVENIAFVGTKGDAVGVYIMRKDGVFQQVISLSDAPLLCLVPGVDVQNNLVFAMTEQLGLIKVGSLPAQRLLPY